MNRTRNLLTLAALSIALAGCVTGCVTPAPGNDPVVIRAEQLSEQSITAVDAFLLWEKSNAAIAGKEVHAAAESLRKQFPKAHKSLRAATKAYKYNRTANNKATLDTWITTVQELVNQAMLNLERVKTKATSDLRKPLMAISPAAVIAALEALLILVAKMQTMIAEAKRNKEWTPEEEALVDAKAESLYKQPHWRTDAENPEPSEEQGKP